MIEIASNPQLYTDSKRDLLVPNLVYTESKNKTHILGSKPPSLVLAQRALLLAKLHNLLLNVEALSLADCLQMLLRNIGCVGLLEENAKSENV